jgi:bifunctional DNase/RNase
MFCSPIKRYIFITLVTWIRKLRDSDVVSDTYYLGLIFRQFSHYVQVNARPRNVFTYAVHSCV